MKLKFRVWHKIENRWLDPWAEEDPMLSLKDCGEGCEVFLYDRNTGDWTNKNCTMEDIVIEQWTGLVDKNSKEIYEGDILSTKHTGQSGYDRDDSKLRVVVRSTKDFQLHLFHIGENEFPASGFGLSITTNRRWIIIGNIHENEDLLSGKV